MTCHRFNSRDEPSHSKNSLVGRPAGKAARPAELLSMVNNLMDSDKVDSPDTHRRGWVSAGESVSPHESGHPCRRRYREPGASACRNRGPEDQCTPPVERDCLPSPYPWESRYEFGKHWVTDRNSFQLLAGSDPPLQLGRPQLLPFAL